MSAFSGILYPEADTVFRPFLTPSLRADSRAYVRVEVDDFAVQTGCWEDMQRFVDALSSAIAASKHVEQDATPVLSGRTGQDSR